MRVKIKLVVETLDGEYAYRFIQYPSTHQLSNDQKRESLKDFFGDAFDEAVTGLMEGYEDGED